MMILFARRGVSTRQVEGRLDRSRNFGQYKGGPTLAKQVRDERTPLDVRNRNQKCRERRLAGK